ncbi:hypothetical protein ACFSX9_12505 [Flavobacterium ardleyense]|uniref:Lipoprotein n=1 Tax=Flavobacterium ardleyense TaxID=2038737 RepID=A0ABW5ZA75_9FLAO
MNIVIKFVLIFGFFIFLSCGNDDTIVPTGNTQEYFKYTLNNGTERVFDSYATGYFVASATADPFKKFVFRASTRDTQGGSIKVDGDFTFSGWTAFSNSTNFTWGVSDGLTANFYFSELTPGHIFFSDPLTIPTSPVTCVVTVHPAAVGDFLEFTFSGSYYDASNINLEGTVSGEGRIRRTADQ